MVRKTKCVGRSHCRRCRFTAAAAAATIAAAICAASAAVLHLSTQIWAVNMCSRLNRRRVGKQARKGGAEQKCK